MLLLPCLHDSIVMQPLHCLSVSCAIPHLAITPCRSCRFKVHSGAVRPLSRPVEEREEVNQLHAVRSCDTEADHSGYDESDDDSALNQHDL